MLLPIGFPKGSFPLFLSPHHQLGGDEHTSFALLEHQAAPSMAKEGSRHPSCFWTLQGCYWPWSLHAQRGLVTRIQCPVSEGSPGFPERKRPLILNVPAKPLSQALSLLDPLVAHQGKGEKQTLEQPAWPLKFLKERVNEIILLSLWSSPALKGICLFPLQSRVGDIHLFPTPNTLATPRAGPWEQTLCSHPLCGSPG